MAFDAPVNVAQRRTDFRAVAESMSELIRSEAESAEHKGSLTEPVVAGLRDTKLFWMSVPTEVGGGGGDLLDAIDVIEALSAADGATGWSFMANSLTTGFAAAYVGESAADAMFGGREPAITAGMLAPAGRAVLVDGGVRGGGRFGFGSGCSQADWMGAGMLLMKDGAPIMDAKGRPQTRICYVPSDRVEFLGNWNVSGLNATGSQDYVVPEQFFADDFAIDGALTSPEPPRRGGDLYRVGLMGFVAVGHAAFALGIMKRALSEIAEIASTKKRLGYASTVANNDIFKRDFSQHESAYRAGRAYCREVFGEVQANVLQGRSPSEEQVARMRVVATWLTQVATDVVRFCHMWAGAAAIRNPSALGRCTRDIHVGTQHMIVDPVSLAQFASPLIASWMPAAPAGSAGGPAGVH